MFDKIFKSSKNKNLTKSISIYISDKHKQIIIAPRYQNESGIIYEQENCFITEYPIDLIVFGTEVIKSLNQYSIKDNSLRDYKTTDWPAFKNSKSKSVVGFENEYINITINSANDSNLILIIEGRPFKTSELTINSTISFYADKQELGQRIDDVYQACLIGKIN